MLLSNNSIILGISCTNSTNKLSRINPISYISNVRVIQRHRLIHVPKKPKLPPQSQPNWMMAQLSADRVNLCLERWDLTQRIIRCERFTKGAV